MTNEKLYSIEDNNVFIPANKWFEKRVVATVKENNSNYIIASLEERYTELSEKVNELVKELTATTDKVKLAGKVVRTKSYICNAKAIGNYEVLLTLLDSIEDDIKKEIDQNIKEKEAICAEAENLLTSNDLKTATDTLRELQTKYKALAQVPDAKNEELKEKFEKIKDDFFKKKQEVHAEFEHELMENLAKKIEICERAESIKDSKEWKKTTEQYQELNDLWKSVGMIPKHRSDELWMRFSTAKDIFFAAKKEHYETVKEEQSEAISKKEELIAKAELLKDSTDWKKTSEEYTQLMEEWKKSGYVSGEKGEAIWNKFLETKNHFYAKKDAHYSGIKIQLEDNYARKIAIVTRAEELQTSNEFELSTNEYLDMMTEWKTIGRVAKEHGDVLWERFLKAKKIFFDRKDTDREKRNEEYKKERNEINAKHRSFLNKLRRELESEEDLLADFEHQIKNISINVRTYDKKEQLEKNIVDIKTRITQLHTKIEEVKRKLPPERNDNTHTQRNRKPQNIDGIIDEVLAEQPGATKQKTATSTSTTTEQKPPIIEEEKSMSDALAALKAKLNKK